MHRHRAALAAAYDAFNELKLNIFAKSVLKRPARMPDCAAMAKNIRDKFLCVLRKRTMTAHAAAPGGFMPAGRLGQGITRCRAVPSCLRRQPTSWPKTLGSSQRILLNLCFYHKIL